MKLRGSTLDRYGLTLGMPRRETPIIRELSKATITQREEPAIIIQLKIGGTAVIQHALISIHTLGRQLTTKADTTKKLPFQVLISKKGMLLLAQVFLIAIYAMPTKSPVSVLYS